MHKPGIPVLPVSRVAEAEECQVEDLPRLRSDFKASLNNLVRLYLKINIIFLVWSFNSVVGHFPTMHKALGSVPSTSDQYINILSHTIVPGHSMVSIPGGCWATGSLSPTKSRRDITTRVKSPEEEKQKPPFILSLAAFEWEMAFRGDDFQTPFR